MNSTVIFRFRVFSRISCSRSFLSVMLVINLSRSSCLMSLNSQFFYSVISFCPLLCLVPHLFSPEETSTAVVCVSLWHVIFSEYLYHIIGFDSVRCLLDMVSVSLLPRPIYINRRLIKCLMSVKREFDKNLAYCAMLSLLNLG